MASPRELVEADNVRRIEKMRAIGGPPTGWIEVNGRPMAYWLPAGVSLLKPVRNVPGDQQAEVRR